MGAKIMGNFTYDDEPKSGNFTYDDAPKKPVDDPSSFKNSMALAISNGSMGLFPSLMTQRGRANLGNEIAGAVKGASSIAVPYHMLKDWISGDKSANSADEYRASMDNGLRELGANTSCSR